MKTLWKILPVVLFVLVSGCASVSEVAAEKRTPKREIVTEITLGKRSFEVPATATDKHGNERTLLITVTANLPNGYSIGQTVIGTYATAHPEIDLTIFVNSPREPEVTVTENKDIVVKIRWEYSVKSGEKEIPCRDSGGALTHRDQCFFTFSLEMAEEFYLPYLFPKKETREKDSVST